MLILKKSSLDNSKILFAILCISLLLQLCIDFSLFILLLSICILVFIRKYKTVSALFIFIVYQIIFIKVFSSSEDDAIKEEEVQKDLRQEKLSDSEKNREAEKEVCEEKNDNTMKDNYDTTMKDNNYDNTKTDNKSDNTMKDNKSDNTKTDNKNDNTMKDNKSDNTKTDNKNEPPYIVVEDFHPTKTYQIVLNVEAENIHSVKDEMNQEISFKTSVTVFN